jgi:hypothetical protein
MPGPMTAERKRPQSGPMTRPHIGTLPRSPRDRMKAAMVRMTGDNREASRLADFVLGGGGVRGRDPGLADLTPLGWALSGYEAGQDIATPGQRIAGGLNLGMAVLPIPGAAKSIRPRAGAMTKGITAYHGSPHQFDQFDASKIGTGEGAQAYGHGLYFAESEDVARGYRDSVSKAHAKLEWDGKPYLPWEVSEELAAVARKAGGYDKTASSPAYIGEQILNGLREGDNLDDMANFVRKSDWAAQEKAGWLSALMAAKERASFQRPAGSMYQVGIQADPDDFLDWEKPLAEQSQRVLSKLEPIVEQKALAEKFGYSVEEIGAMAPERIAQLRDMAGDLSHARSQVLKTPAANFYESKALVPGEYRDPAQASAKLRDSGIAGIRYKDGFSRGLDGAAGTRNYVVFDPKIVDIMKRYGVAAPVAAAMLAGGQAKEAP